MKRLFYDQIFTTLKEILCFLLLVKKGLLFPQLHDSYTLKYDLKHGDLTPYLVFFLNFICLNSAIGSCTVVQ
jgi:hypothetical protein